MSSTTSTNALGTRLVTAAVHRWTALPSRTLARKLFNENRGVWPSVESVRTSILWHRGRRAGKKQARVKNPAPCTAPRVAWNPHALPPSDEQPFEPYSVTVARDTRALILGDVHVPYHNLPALRATIERGLAEEVSIILINGDLLDFHRLSRFQKDPRARNARQEVDRAKQFLDALDDTFPKARKILKAGNHDERYDLYLAAQAPEIYDLVADLCTLPLLLELADRGWEYVADKRPIFLGSLPVIHGHEYPTPVLGPVNAARGLFLRAKECALVNHHHQTSEHTETTIKGKMLTTWSLGCLCDLHPAYARFNKWNHGAATVDLAASGDYQVHNFRIHAGRVLN